MKTSSFLLFIKLPFPCVDATAAYLSVLFFAPPSIMLVLRYLFFIILSFFFSFFLFFLSQMQNHAPCVTCCNMSIKYFSGRATRAQDLENHLSEDCCNIVTDSNHLEVILRTFFFWRGDSQPLCLPREITRCSVEYCPMSQN